MNNIEIQQYQPDWLDLQCDKVFEALKDVPTDLEKIEVLKQVIDYLEMAIASEGEK